MLNCLTEKFTKSQISIIIDYFKTFWNRISCSNFEELSNGTPGYCKTLSLQNLLVK